ncbi:SUMO-specific isopeptidase USPL1 isoform X1 [Alosa pseudoharengus]|uniref:SUMO-specific isopeptidase USPL1 isoform X1 n=2 Tax=Alosa pseudoharengus TaxID=34774 RepID=UPI003F8AD8C3
MFSLTLFSSNYDYVSKLLSTQSYFKTILTCLSVFSSRYDRAWRMASSPIRMVSGFTMSGALGISGPTPAWAGYLGKSQDKDKSVPAETCPWCEAKGQTVSLRSYIINHEETIRLCPTPTCIFPLVSRPLEAVLASLSSTPASTTPDQNHSGQTPSTPESPAFLPPSAKRPRTEEPIEACSVDTNGTIRPDQSSQVEDTISKPNAVAKDEGEALVRDEDNDREMVCTSTEELMAEPVTKAAQEPHPRVSTTEEHSKVPCAVVEPSALPAEEQSRSDRSWLSSLLLALAQCRTLRLLSLGRRQRGSRGRKRKSPTQDASPVLDLCARYESASDHQMDREGNSLRNAEKRLTDLRSSTFQLLQHPLQQKRELMRRPVEVPALALPVLLELDSQAKELFQHMVQWESQCLTCGCSSSSSCTNTASAYAYLVSDWHPLSPPVQITCSRCQSINEKKILKERVPPVFAVHFADGFPQNDVTACSFGYADAQYAATVVIQHKASEDLFISWSRQTDGSWIAYEEFTDLRGISHSKLDIPTKEIHMVFWEVEPEDTRKTTTQETSIVIPPPTETTSVDIPPPTESTSVDVPPPTESTSVDIPPPMETTSVDIPPPLETTSVDIPPPLETTSVDIPAPTETITVDIPLLTDCQAEEEAVEEIVPSHDQSLLTPHEDTFVSALKTSDPGDISQMDTSIGSATLLDTFEGLSHNDIVTLTLETEKLGQPKGKNQKTPLEPPAVGGSKLTSEPSVPEEAQVTAVSSPPVVRRSRRLASKQDKQSSKRNNSTERGESSEPRAQPCTPEKPKNTPEKLKSQLADCLISPTKIMAQNTSTLQNTTLFIPAHQMFGENSAAPGTTLYIPVAGEMAQSLTSQIMNLPNSTLLSVPSENLEQQIQMTQNQSPETLEVQEATTPASSKKKPVPRNPPKKKMKGQVLVFQSPEKTVAQNSTQSTEMAVQNPAGPTSGTNLSLRTPTVQSSAQLLQMLEYPTFSESLNPLSMQTLASQNQTVKTPSLATQNTQATHMPAVETSTRKNPPPPPQTLDDLPPDTIITLNLDIEMDSTEPGQLQPPEITLLSTLNTPSGQDPLRSPSANQNPEPMSPTKQNMKGQTLVIQSTTAPTTVILNPSPQTLSIQNPATQPAAMDNPIPQSVVPLNLDMEMDYMEPDELPEEPEVILPSIVSTHPQHHPPATATFLETPHSTLLPPLSTQSSSTTRVSLKREPSPPQPSKQQSSLPVRPQQKIAKTLTPPIVKLENAKAAEPPKVKLKPDLSNAPPVKPHMFTGFKFHQKGAPSSSSGQEGPAGVLAGLTSRHNAAKPSLPTNPSPLSGASQKAPLGKMAPAKPASAALNPRPAAAALLKIKKDPDQASAAVLEDVKTAALRLKLLKKLKAKKKQLAELDQILRHRGMVPLSCSAPPSVAAFTTSTDASPPSSSSQVTSPGTPSTPSTVSSDGADMLDMLVNGGGDALGHLMAPSAPVKSQHAPSVPLSAPSTSATSADFLTIDDFLDDVIFDTSVTEKAMENNDFDTLDMFL